LCRAPQPAPRLRSGPRWSAARGPHRSLGGHSPCRAAGRPRRRPGRAAAGRLQHFRCPTLPAGEPGLARHERHPGGPAERAASGALLTDPGMYIKGRQPGRGRAGAPARISMPPPALPGQHIFLGWTRWRCSKRCRPLPGYRRGLRGAIEWPATVTIMGHRAHPGRQLDRRPARSRGWWMPMANKFHGAYRLARPAGRSRSMTPPGKPLTKNRPAPPRWKAALQLQQFAPEHRAAALRQGAHGLSYADGRGLAAVYFGVGTDMVQETDGLRKNWFSDLLAPRRASPKTISVEIVSGRRTIRSRN